MQAQQSVGNVYASDAAVKGDVRQTSAGLEVSNGSVITAGQHSATLRLSRGGQVRICPGTNLTVNRSVKGQELMFAMSAGSLEAQYALPPIADAILTPDFRILISGPASVDLSVSAQANGDACVRSRGEDSYIVVSELMGNDFYRLQGNEQALFHAGHAKDPEINGPTICGCPAPPPVERAEIVPAPPTPDQKAAALSAVKNEPAVAAAASAAAALPPQQQGNLQIQVDAPMVFRGNDAAPDVTATLARVHMEHLPWPGTPVVAPQPPAAPARTKQSPEKAEKKGFLHRLVKALFG
ncbi:MAG: hypothetical protein JOZ10_06165 [Acidobacteria bacterium]|nr:hypothetical protein [Acidobacteriota bacterium]MBV9434822.1 hypothetical protein [Acidobacteriota bacterium]